MSSILLVCMLVLPGVQSNPASWDISMGGAVVEDGLFSFSHLSQSQISVNLEGASTSLSQLFLGEWWQTTCSASMSKAPTCSPAVTGIPQSSSASMPTVDPLASAASIPSFNPFSTLSSSPLPSFTPLTPSSFPSPAPVVPSPPNITAILLTLSNINVINIFLAFSQALETRGIVLSQLILALLTTLAAPPVRRMEEWSGGGKPRLLDTVPLVGADVFEILGTQYLLLNLSAPLLLQELQRQLFQSIYGNTEVVKLLLILSGQSYSLTLTTPPAPPLSPFGGAGRRGRALQGFPPPPSQPLSLIMDPSSSSPFGFSLRASFPPSTPTYWWDTSTTGGTDFGLSSYGNGDYSTARVQRLLALFTLMLPVSLDAQAAAQVVVRTVIQINVLLAGLGLSADSLLGYVVGPGGGSARILQAAPPLPGDSLYTLLIKLVAAITLTQAKILQLAILQKQVLEAALCGVWAV